MPAGLPQHLLFGYRQDSLLQFDSGDGVISLGSRLVPAAQEGAATMRGYDEGHVSILANPEVAALLNRLLDSKHPD